MGVPKLSVPYATNEHFLHEVQEFGGGFFGTDGWIKLGGALRASIEEFTNFVNHRGPDGKLLLRWQKNSGDWVYAPLWTIDPSITAKLNTFSVTELIKFRDEAVIPAALLAHQAYDARCCIRRTVNGLQVIEKAKTIGMIGVHLLARDRQLFLHVYDMFQRGAVTEKGEVFSLASGRLVMKQTENANLLFQSYLATAITESFGWKVEMKNGRATLPDVPEYAQNVVGARRKSIEEYLKARGIGSTERARNNAAQNSRPKWDTTQETLAERVREWNSKTAKFDSPKATREEVATWKSRLLGLVTDFIILPAKVLKAAYVSSRGRSPMTVRVRDARQFLDDTRIRSRREGHLAALRAVRRTRVSSLNEALDVARRGFKQGRKPLFTPPKGTIVAVSAKALEVLTKKEIEELRGRAMKYGWVLTLGQQRQQHEQTQSQS